MEEEVEDHGVEQEVREDQEEVEHQVLVVRLEHQEQLTQVVAVEELRVQV